MSMVAAVLLWRVLPGRDTVRQAMATDALDQIFEHLADGELDEALSQLDTLLIAHEFAPRLHALRARILLATNRATEATISVKRALALDAEDAYIHRTAAEVWIELQEPAAAVAAARQALAIDADDHEAIILEARARTLLGHWDQVVSRCDYVLMFEPTNEGAAILRAIALASKKGNRLTLGSEDWEQLARSFPLNAFARAGHAWKLLEWGDRSAAEEQFQQALALDPSSAFAKRGLVATLKAKYPGYSLLLKYFFWMNELSPRTRTFVAIGGLLGYNFLRRSARLNPELEPFLLPFIIAYAVFIFMTWMADPLLSLVLMVLPEGRKFLSEDDKQSGLLVGAFLGAAIVFAILAETTEWRGAFNGVLTMAATSFTVAGAFKCEDPYRARLLRVATFFAAAGLLSTVVSNPLAGILVVIVVVGMIISAWVARSWSEASYA